MNAEKLWDHSAILQLANAQQRLIFSMIGTCVILLLAFVPGVGVVGAFIIGVLGIIMMLISGVTTYHVSKRILSGNMSWIISVLAGFLSFAIVGFVAMWWVSRKARKILNQHGISVGLLGVES